LSIGILSGAAGSTTVNLTGTIRDSLTHKGIANATVVLKSCQSITATTDASGGYSLSGTVTATVESRLARAFEKPIVTAGGIITFSIAERNEPVAFAIYKVNGERVATLLDKNLKPGSYRINPAAAGLSNQLYFIKIRIGTQIHLLKYMSFDVAHRTLCSAISRDEKSFNADAMVLGKAQSATVVDTVVVTASRHKTLLMPIGDYSGTANFTVLSSVRQALANVVSVSSKGINGAGLSKRKANQGFTEPTVNPGFINSGAPDSLRVRLKRIILKGDTALHLGTSIWEGDKQFTLTGKGTIDVGDMVLDSFPLWQVQSVELWFNDTATIWGSFTGIFNTDTTGTKFQSETKTYYTKSAYSYDAFARTGGADSTVGRSVVFETAPAESSFIRLAGNSNGIAMVSTTDTFTFDTTEAQPAMTILFDLNRMLRFYDGCRLTEGASQGDPFNKAYFFCHSVFLNSIASFFGKPGQIQGYQSLYNVTGRNEGVPGWMTLIWKASGELLTGILIGDDDNALVVAKGRITSMAKTDADTTYSFHYDCSNVDMVAFKKCVNLGDSTIGWWNQTVPMGNNQPFTGGAKFTLRFKTN
jgi:hypothetical protein